MTRSSRLILCVIALLVVLTLGGCRSVGISPATTPELAATRPEATPAPSPILTVEPTTQIAHSPPLLFGAGNPEDIIFVWSTGQAVQPVAHGRPLYGHPLSPDGRRMIIDAEPDNREPDPEIAILNLSDGHIEPLHLLSKPHTVHWSPDGRELLYVYVQDSGDQLVVYDFATGDNTPLASMSIIFFAAGWSADGRQIAFVANDDGQYDLYVLDVNTQAVRRLTNTLAVETAAVWSPVESTLLVGTDRYDEGVMREGYLAITTLHLIDSDGRSQTLGTYDSIAPPSLAWSPDGQQIAFADNGALCILDLTTSHTTCPLKGTTPFGAYVTGGDPPAWSPDGRWLAFRATGFKNSLCFGIYALELATGKVRFVEEGSCETGLLFWVND